jgi:hypothetical protein
MENVVTRLLATCPWKPTREKFVAELERLLPFAESENRLTHFVPRLNSRKTQYHEALNELRVAYFFHHNGFPIIQWEPRGASGKVGECVIGTPEGKNVFVEVKSPGWEGELDAEERKSGRTKLPKYHGPGGGGAVAPYIGHLKECVSRAYPKFAPTAANLLVVADDFFIPLAFTEIADAALYDKADQSGDELGIFGSRKYENVGGIGIFDTDSEATVEYTLQVFRNPFALPQTALPDSIGSRSGVKYVV